MLADSAVSCSVATGGTVKERRGESVERLIPWGDYDPPQGVQCSLFG